MGLYFDVPQAQDLADLIDFAAWRSAPQADWYGFVIGAVMVAALLLGGCLIALNLRRRSFGRLRSPATDATGSIDVDVSRLAAAVARHIAELPRVEQVRPLLRVVRGQRTVMFTVQARPGVEMAALRDVLEQAERDFREAVPGIDLDTTYRVHLLSAET